MGTEEKQEVVVDFGVKVAPPRACTFNTCLQGHNWPARLALVECPGCKAQVLVVAMENCPVCNEPTKAMTLRTDHVVMGGGVVARCAGQENSAECMEVVMERGHWGEAEEKHSDSEQLFKDRTKTKDMGKEK